MKDSCIDFDGITSHSERTKKCARCGVVKPLDEFVLSSDRRDGRGCYCRPCHRARTRERYASLPVVERGDSAPKLCENCGHEKPRSEFNVHRSTRDGLHAKCRECHRAAARDHYESNVEHRKATSKALKEAHPERAKVYTRNQRKAHPDRVRARQSVSDAIKAGRLVRPDRCSSCLTEGAVEFDHTNGYDEPNWFVGVFVCKPCHWKNERERRARGRS